MANADFMTHQTLSSRSDWQQRLAVWTRGCVVVAGFALLGLIVVLTAVYRSHRQPPLQASPLRINPNTATMASLVRLPGVGKARAMDIIHYRESQGRDELVFLSADDLQAIRGIGPKTAAALEPWLTFETE